jgi:flavorubredoxin
LLPVYKLFAVVNPIRDRGKLAAAFGSYGWSGEGVKIIEETLKVLKLNIAVDGLAVKFYPGQDKSSKFIQFGQQFAEEFNKPVA